MPPETASQNLPQFDLDALEAHAVSAIYATYGEPPDDAARFWTQKGIEGMRLAVAKAQQGVGRC